MARARRLYDWAGFVFGATTLSVTQSILGSFIDIEPVTFMRHRGNLYVKATPDATGDDTVVGLGLIVVSDNAAAAGGASVPGPINDPDAPWVWHQYVPLDAGTAGLTGDDIGSNVRVMIDSKAQRKVGINETMILVGELSLADFASVRLSGGVRALAMHS